MKIKRSVIIIAVSLLLCFALTGCLGVVGGILTGLDAVIRYVQGFGEDELPEQTVYGSANPLAVSFRDGKMVAIWDYTDNVNYVLSVTDDNDITTVYDPSDTTHAEYKDCYGDGIFYLENAGYDYSDSVELTLKSVYKNNTYDKVTASYDGLSKADYEAYTANVPGGFTTIDSYIATRYEMFEYFAYLLIFRPNSTEVAEKGVTYEKVEQEFLIAYDYQGLYDGTITADKAFESEVMSAVASFEDSAAYNYSYERDGNIGKYVLRFYYDENPYLITSSKDTYVNVYTNSEPPHYDTTVEHDRTFAIDDRTQSVSVSSSDQLYFAIKKGYKPVPVAGSNAEYIYAELRRILSLINSDSDSVPTKIHHIYDYIVNTVIYDYDFVENTLEQEVDDQSIFFSYECLYLEGVLGYVPSSKSFSTKNRVAICDGLSKAFLCFTQIEGIESLKISGTASGGAHAWNKVCVNNRWYMVDTTWGNVLNSSSATHKNYEYLSHDYLMTRDDSDHEEDKWYSYPKATGKYNFIFSN